MTAKAYAGSAVEVEYEIRYKVDGGPYQTLSEYSATATAKIPIEKEKTYIVRVNARAKGCLAAFEQYDVQEIK